MQFERKKGKRKLTYFMVAAAVSVLFLLLCACKQIYPFGEGTIDTIDFGSQWVPAYYHVWDFLHGEGSLLFDWNAAGGMDFSGSASQFVLLSPFNLLFLFVGRSQIQQFMTFFILIKLAAMGLSMCFFLEKRSRGLREEIPWIVAGSTAYALSGYTFQYYGMGWVDVAVILPILIHCFEGMAKKEQEWKPGRYAIGYLLCLTLVFVISIPQAYMICIFLILYAGGYFFIKREDGTCRKGGMLKFGLVSLLSLGLSAVIFLPAALSILRSYRMSGAEYGGENGYFWLLGQSGMDARIKWIMLLGVLIPFLYLVVTVRKKRSCLWQSYLVAVMVIPVAVEAVNLVWHKGTYMCFPMRHGYMMIFAILAMAYERSQERLAGGKVKIEGKKKGILTGAVIAVWGVVTFGIGMDALFSNTHGKEVDFVRDAEEIGTVLAEESDVFHKVKIADASLDSNYPLIAGVASYSNNLHILTAEQINALRSLGYSQIWTRLSDTGGTLFSDALLGYQYTVNHRQSGNGDAMEMSCYENYETTEHFSILKNRYTYGTGIRIDLESYRQYNGAASANVFENQNMISNMLFGEDFFTTWTESFADEKVNETLVYEIPVEKEGMLYLYSKELSGAEIFVNGELLPVPSYENLSGTRYLSEHNNGILTLGLFEGETVTVEIRQTCYDTMIPKQIQFGILDMAAFADSVAACGEDTVTYELGKKSLKISASAKEEEFLLLPVNADGGWKYTINGGEEGMARIFGNLTLIQLKPGENEIVLTYVPGGLEKGAAVTILTVVVLALWAALARIKKADNVIGKIYHGLSYGALAVFALVFAGCLLVVYVVPMVYSLYLKLFGGMG
ncbi:MAG: YfhO family protein [Roseburia sp.]|nr:YfhO family protein [Roseburia sp.]